MSAAKAATNKEIAQLILYACFIIDHWDLLLFFIILVKIVLILLFYYLCIFLMSV